MSKRTRGEMTTVTSGVASKTFLDQVCEAALINVFHYHAARPQTADWKQKRNHKTLCDVNHPDHPLRSVAQDIVKELNLVELDEQDQISILNA